MSGHREAVIDADAITHNVRRLRAMTKSGLIAVVKADGYGHGAVTAARAALAGGAHTIGVADIDEALALRRAGIADPLLAWLHGPDQNFTAAISEGVELGVSRREHLDAIAASGGAARIHLKLETGLGRNGLAPADWSEVFARAAEHERAGALCVAGIFSHLSNTSAADDADAIARFRAAIAAASAAGLAPKHRHLAATQASFAVPEAWFDTVRVGLGIYGLSPFQHRTSAELGLRPAMTLRGEIVAVRRVPAGQGVSYGFDYRTERETTLALVPLGYADGIPRQASGRGPVLIGGKRYTVSGRVAMDQFVVDVGETRVRPGDEVIVFGDPQHGVPSADEWGRAAETINYDIVTRVGARVMRRTR